MTLENDRQDQRVDIGDGVELLPDCVGLVYSMRDEGLVDCLLLRDGLAIAILMRMENGEGR